MISTERYINNAFLSQAILICNHCGSYIPKNNEIFQACHCANILVLDGKIQPEVKLITDCKMCSLLAFESNS